jgi:ABC-type sugar transport system ATPase subunit
MSTVAGFLGNPPMNIIPTTYEGDRLTVKFDLAHLFVFDGNNGQTVIV